MDLSKIKAEKKSEIKDEMTGGDIADTILENE